MVERVLLRFSVVEQVPCFSVVEQVFLLQCGRGRFSCFSVVEQVLLLQFGRAGSLASVW